jgi:hypothetical protein
VREDEIKQIPGAGGVAGAKVLGVLGNHDAQPLQKLETTFAAHQNVARVYLEPLIEFLFGKACKAVGYRKKEKKEKNKLKS